MNQRGPWPIHRNRTPELYRASAWDESGVFVMNEKEKDRLSGLFLCLKFSTYRIFSGKAKKFRLVIGIFEKKQF
jgi:hypothetical protein